METGWVRGIMIAVLVAVASLVGASTSAAAPVPPPEWLIVEDRPWDDGTSLDIRFPLSKEDTDPANPVRYQIQMSGEYLGLYADLIQVTATPEQRRRNEITARASELNLGEPYWFRIRTVDAAGARSAFVETGLQGVRPRRQWFDGRRFWLLMISLLICAAGSGTSSARGSERGTRSGGSPASTPWRTLSAARPRWGGPASSSPACRTSTRSRRSPA